jgi:putative transposase
VLADVGPVKGRVPRAGDAASYVQAAGRRVAAAGGCPGVGEIVLSLSAKGLAHGEIAAQLTVVQEVETLKPTISNITDKVPEGMAEWQNRPLDRVYPMLCADTINGGQRKMHLLGDECGQQQVFEGQVQGGRDDEVAAWCGHRVGAGGCTGSRL